MATEISKSAFEAVDGKLDGKLSPKQKEYLQNLATNVIKEKNTPDSSLATHPGKVQYFVEPDEDFSARNITNTPLNRYRTWVESYENPVEKFEKTFGIKNKLNSLKGVQTWAEIQSRLNNNQEDAALIQTYLVLNGKLKTNLGVKEIDGNPKGKTLQAITEYRNEETPRQEQQKKNEEAKEKGNGLNQETFEQKVRSFRRDLITKDYSINTSQDALNKNPMVLVSKWATIDVKTHNSKTGEITTKKTYPILHAQVNIKDYLDKALNPNNTAFDAEVKKQLDAALKTEQEKQDKLNKSEETAGNQIKAKNNREKELANNRDKFIKTIEGKKLTITEKSFGNLPKEVSDYNASYPYNKLEKSQLTQTFINKFENNSLAFRKVNIVGNNLEFSFKAKDPIENNRSYMKNIKIPLKEVMDENNNLINDKFISQASNKMGKSFDSFVKEAVQQQQQIRIAEKKTQDKQLASV